MQKEIEELYRLYKVSLNAANFGILSGNVDVSKLEKVALDLHNFRVAVANRELCENTGRNLSPREHKQLEWYTQQKPIVMKNGSIVYPALFNFMYELENDVIKSFK